MMKQQNKQEMKAIKATEAPKAPIIDKSDKRSDTVRRVEQVLDAMREVLVIVLLATCLIFLMSAFWQAYNIYLFRGNDRRKAVPMPSDAELAAAFSLSLPNYHAVQESSFVEVSSLDDFGYHVKARPVREA